MTLSELEQLAKDATPGPWSYRETGWSSYLTADGKTAVVESTVNNLDMRYIAAANPETILRLIELVRLQHEALEFTNINGFCAEESCYKMEQAIAKFKEIAG